MPSNLSPCAPLFNVGWDFCKSPVNAPTLKRRWKGGAITRQGRTSFTTIILSFYRRTRLQLTVSWQVSSSSSLLVLFLSYRKAWVEGVRANTVESIPQTRHMLSWIEGEACAYPGWHRWASSQSATAAGSLNASAKLRLQFNQIQRFTIAKLTERSSLDSAIAWSAYVAIYACMYLCMHVRMHICVYVMYVCVDACMHVCMYALRYIYIYMRMHLCVRAR